MCSPESRRPYRLSWISAWRKINNDKTESVVLTILATRSSMKVNRASERPKYFHFKAFLRRHVLKRFVEELSRGGLWEMSAVRMLYISHLQISVNTRLRLRVTTMEFRLCRHSGSYESTCQARIILYFSTWVLNVFCSKRNEEFIRIF